jgi:hypothetical protein
MKKQLCAIGLVLTLVAPASAQPLSASDKVAKRLEELLQPAGKSAPSALSNPIAWPGPKSVEQPQLPPGAYQGTPPSPPLPAPARPKVPRAVAEPPAPVGDARPPVGPSPVVLPTEPLIQLPTIDVDTPLPLPILATPKPDRAALDDTTLETSHAAALHPIRPRRVEHVPFSPINLPDPFENVRTGTLRNPPEESDQPPAIPIRTPSR